VYEKEGSRIQANLLKLLPLMRPAAAAVAARAGFLSRRRKAGTTMLRVVGGWCVFFNAGCVLHEAGAAEGDKFRYKPLACATFPLESIRAVVGTCAEGTAGRDLGSVLFDPPTARPAAVLGEELVLIERSRKAIRVRIVVLVLVFIPVAGVALPGSAIIIASAAASAIFRRRSGQFGGMAPASPERIEAAASIAASSNGFSVDFGVSKAATCSQASSNSRAGRANRFIVYVGFPLSEQLEDLAIEAADIRTTKAP
jgi:hypothetical protein